LGRAFEEVIANHMADAVADAQAVRARLAAVVELLPGPSQVRGLERELRQGVASTAEALDDMAAIIDRGPDAIRQRASILTRAPLIVPRIDEGLVPDRASALGVRCGDLTIEIEPIPFPTG
jgi:hypothetical protein